MQTTIRNSVIAAAASLSLLAACQSAPVPSQILTKPAPVAAPMPIVHSGAPLLYRPSTEPQRFVVDQKAVVAIRVDTSTHTDTVASHAEVTFSAAPATHGVTGTVGAFLVEGAGHPSATPEGLVTPFPVRGAYPARGLQLEFSAPFDTAPCSSMALGAAQSLRDLWFQPPDTLRAGSTWSDSSKYVICRDGIALHATVHRLFHVSATSVHDGHPHVAITRLARTVIDGGGSQFGDQVTMSGSGNGELVYDFDLVSGGVISASGNATLDLSLRSSQRTQLVHQTVEIKIGRS
jgi:hypothetical protein